MTNIAFESESNLLKWWKEFEKQDNCRITLPWIPYSEPEITRELNRRENCRDVQREAWLNQHKIQPCPICKKEFSKRGRGMAWCKAREHVLICKGEKK